MEFLADNPGRPNGEHDPPSKVARVSESPDGCFWLDDSDVLGAIREIESIPPSNLEVKHVIDFYKRYPKHPIVLSCLGDSMEKVCAGIDPECIADFLFQTKKGTRRSSVFLRDVIKALVEVGVEDTTEYKGNPPFLPTCHHSHRLKQASQYKYC